MKKYYCLFALILICTIFIGCGSKTPAGLSDDLSSEIAQKLGKKMGTEAQWDGESGYYGTYQGAVVFNENGIDYGMMYLDAITKITVGGVTFSWPNAFTIYAYKDGEFYDLETAYEKGLLTKENIESIAERHDEFLAERTNWGDRRP